jgi:GNAT superfamily N-acetyltransferase
MTADDVPTAMLLKTEAGWNQVEADWHRFLVMQPDGCFVAERGGEVVGTTVTCVFGDIAWVAMVLVAKRVRGQRIATALMGHALAYLDANGAKSVRLDATPLGKPIYERMGFAPEYTLARYEGFLAAADAVREWGDASCRVRAATQSDLERLVVLDRDVTGTTREKFLARLFQEHPDAFRVAEQDGKLLGYVTTRPGASAIQLGPCIGTVEAGRALVADAGGRLSGKRLFVDVPIQHKSMVALAERAGLSVQRALVRMGRGRGVREYAARLLVSSGPELG